MKKKAAVDNTPKLSESELKAIAEEREAMERMLEEQLMWSKRSSAQRLKKKQSRTAAELAALKGRVKKPQKLLEEVEEEKKVDTASVTDEVTATSHLKTAAAKEKKNEDKWKAVKSTQTNHNKDIQEGEQQEQQQPKLSEAEIKAITEQREAMEEMLKGQQWNSSSAQKL
eukprot:CAMPEP_0194171584 /NCGR_PEP_ID=MMETSP0154-20130528/6143_1 /TAXON_ID=1049557 /ORGANISM="Thalassiothrix antarctica, Strain L6-D1" /LENGTH=169 /DNA_ID=CAMNT_0038883935 /DNA_START=190 /DNA_END=696 /DNA_ORIENTATION=-